MDSIQKEQMWEQFKALEAKGITMNHYDLARVTSIKDVQLWKQFLTDPEVVAYIDQEAQILTQSELRKLASDVSDSRSVGQAQLINAMSKLTENKTLKEGPIFIYSYVPLSENQMKADNVRIEDHDVFAVGEPEKQPEVIEQTINPMMQYLQNLEIPDEEEF